MAVHGDDFVCLSDDDGLEHIDNLLKSKYTAKDVGTLGFKDSDVKSLLLLNRVFRVGTDRNWATHGHWTWLETRTAQQQWIRKQCEHENSEYTTRETTRQTGVRRKTESDSEERRCDKIRTCLHETFHTWPKTDWILQKPRNFWPREWASLVNSTLSHRNVQRDIWLGNTKRRCEISKIRTCWQDRSLSWTATLLATQARARVRRDCWLRLVTTPFKSGSTLQSLTALSAGEAEFYAVVIGGQVGPALRSIYQDLGIPMKVEMRSDSSSLKDRLGAG